MVEGVVKVTRKYQVTIPKSVRRKVGIGIGDVLRVSDKGELIVLRKLHKGERLPELEGCWGGYPEDLEEFMKEPGRLWSTWKV